MKTTIVTMILAIIMVGCGMAEGPSSYNSASYKTGISNTVDSPKEMKVGDLMAVEIESGAVINFEGVDSYAKFMMVVGNLNPELVSSVTIDGSVVTEIDKSMTFDEEKNASPEDEDYQEYGADETFSAWMRGSEVENSNNSNATPAYNDYNMSKAMSETKDLSEGTTKSFYVLNSLNSLSDYVTVRADAECVGEHIAIFVDRATSSSNLTDEDIELLCEESDRAVGMVKRIVGDPSDINEDGLVTVLLTPQINKLGRMGGGIITGYFYSGDLYNGTGSNKQEIVYSLVPDPAGTYGVAISKSFALDNLIRAVIPHEVQHAINYNQKVFVNNTTSEESWLNEALSHLMEDLTGYNIENPSRYSSFLSNPSTTSLVAPGSPSIQERGAAYLFLRFLYEQAPDGEEFLRRLVQSDQTGIAAVEYAFNGADENFNEFPEFMARWTVAMAMTDRGISSDGRYNYRERKLNINTGNYEGVVLIGDADDFRGTYLSGPLLTTYTGYHAQSVSPSAAKYFTIENFPDRIDFEPDINGQYAILIRTE